MQVLSPSDRNELILQLREALDSKKPTYIRIGKKGEPDLFDNSKNLGIGKANIISEGNEILLLAIGPIVSEALKAVEILKENISVAVATMGGVKPIDNQFLETMARRGFKKWVTLEEHSIIGGLGSTILEWISANNIYNKINVHRLGIKDSFINELGNKILC